MVMEGEGVLVRRARAGDLERLINIHDRDKGPTTGVAFERAIALSECTVAEMQGGIGGCACMDYGFFGRGFVSLLYVANAARRRGIGNKLLETLEKECTSDRIFTSTNLSNLPMQSLLNARSYVLSGVVKDLDAGDPELFYSKQLR
jgi:N-acetylglutamate synthase-like GNAT family acetyltransferase